MTDMIINVELSDDQAYALSQFCKRVGWQEWRQNSASDEEAYFTRDAFDQLAHALAEQGYKPR